MRGIPLPRSSISPSHANPCTIKGLRDRERASPLASRSAVCPPGGSPHNR